MYNREYKERSELIGKINALARRLDDLVLPEVGGAGVAVFNNANIGIPSAAWTALTFNSERWDDMAFHSVAVNTSRLTVPTGYDGWYVISGGVYFDASAAGTARYVGILLNGVVNIALQTKVGTATDRFFAISTVYYLSATDFVELQVYQDTGGNLNVLAVGNYSPEFRMVRI